MGCCTVAMKASKLIEKLASHVGKGASDLDAVAIVWALHGCARLQYSCKEVTELLALRVCPISHLTFLVFVCHYDCQ